MKIDLHAHSSVSDGTDAPAQLVRTAAAAGLDVVALTDHDTLAGWAEALAAAPPGLEVVPGVELSAYADEAAGRVSLHLLGYWPDPADEPLQQAMRALRESRNSRARAMVEKLAAAGVPVTWAEVEADADGAVVGRPHVARALVRAGLVPDVSAAFGAEWLATGGPFYVDKLELEVLAAVRLVRAAGGVPVFAHPRALRRGPTVADATIAAMAAAGLAGLEVDHPDHEPDQREQLRALAAQLDLVTTGSSDYHGSNKPTAIGACTTTPAALQALRDQRRDQCRAQQDPR